MTEAWLYEPPPEENDHWEPEPARCAECGSIVDARPNDDGEWEGFCSFHGTLMPVVYRSSQEPEKDDEDREEP